MVKKSITKKLLKYHDLLKREGIPVKRMILFGSHVSGKIRRNSDIDVCVVSPLFGKNRIEEGKLLYLLAIQIDPLIEPISFSPEQYTHDMTSPLLDEIRKKGVRVC